MRMNLEADYRKHTCRGKEVASLTFRVLTCFQFSSYRARMTRPSFEILRTGRCLHKKIHLASALAAD